MGLNQHNELPHARRLLTGTLALVSGISGAVDAATNATQPTFKDEPANSPLISVVSTHEQAILDMLPAGHPNAGSIKAAIESLKDGGNTTELTNLFKWALSISTNPNAPVAAKKHANEILDYLTGKIKPEAAQGATPPEITPDVKPPENENNDQQQPPKAPGLSKDDPKNLAGKVRVKKGGHLEDATTSGSVQAILTEDKDGVISILTTGKGNFSLIITVKGNKLNVGDKVKASFKVVSEDIPKTARLELLPKGGKIKEKALWSDQDPKTGYVEGIYEVMQKGLDAVEVRVHNETDAGGGGKNEIKVSDLSVEVVKAGELAKK